MAGASQLLLTTLLAPTGRREYLFRVILISNQRFIQLKIHHRKMEEQKQLFYNAREKVVEAEKAEKEEDDKRDR
ncbi:hypothetical protein ACHAO7_005496 [Fusarium culmorum]